MEDRQDAKLVKRASTYTLLLFRNFGNMMERVMILRISSTFNKIICTI
jgi:hypothetical protein